MQKILYACTALMVLTPLTVLGFYYWKFRHSAVCLWRNRVRHRLEQLRTQIESPDQFSETQRKASYYYNDLFARHLQSIPAQVLQGSPGIGPATMDRLHAAGFRGFSQLLGYDFQTIQGFGPVKSAEVAEAVSSIWRDAKARFEAGACPEGLEYRRLWAEMSAADRAENDARLQKNAAIERAIASLRPLVVLANDVTFWNQLLNKGDVPGLTDEILDRPLPDSAIDASEPLAQPVYVVPIPPSTRVPAFHAVVAQAVDTRTESKDIFQQALQQSIPTAEAVGSEHPHLPKLKAYCAFALVVARADGRIAKSERQKVRDLLASAFGHDATLLRFIDPLMEQTEKSELDEDEVLTEVCRLTSPKERSSLYSAAEKIVDASGGRNAREVEALLRIASALEVTVVAERLTGRTGDGNRTVIAQTDEPPGLSRWGTVSGNPTGTSPVARDETPTLRAILEIEPAWQLSPELIRRRFLLLTERADPAKAAALGPEFAAMAEAKRADIRKAALQLMEPFGEPLEPPAAPPPPSDIRHNPDLDDVFGA